MKRWLALVAMLVIVAQPLPGYAANEVAPLGRFDLAPYRVVVFVAFAPDAETTPTFRGGICSAVATRIGQAFGTTWDLLPSGEVHQDDKLTPPNESGLDRLTPAIVGERLQKIACDKAIFLSVDRKGPTWLLAGREWDNTTQRLGSTANDTTLDRRHLPDAALGLIKRIYSPIVLIDDADRESKAATLTIRAGSLPLPDAKFEPLKAGDLLVPVFRFLDAKRAVRSVQSVPWTYLVLDQATAGQGQVTATVVSSYRAPLAANMRRRVEAVAIRLRPDRATTQLELVVGRNPPQPQGGLFVTISELTIKQAKTAPVDASKKQAVPTRAPAVGAPVVGAPILRLLSDRSGRVTIPVDPAHPLVRLEVHSGTSILVRRPFVPGIQSELTLQIGDDSTRLATEREIDLLEGQLIETVAQRGALMARTRAALKRNDAVEAAKLLADVQQLPSADKYAAELNQIRVLSLEEAKRRKDRISERRIEDLCKKTSDRITQYLPDDRIQVFKEEINSLLNAKKVKVPEGPLRRGAAPKRANLAPLKRQKGPDRQPGV